MLSDYHKNRTFQLILGLITGIAFGIFLQKGGVTYYDVILGQLLLTDFTVVKLMVTAILVGMPGVYLLIHLKHAKLHINIGSVSTIVIGGLIFGAGFAVLGLCPGTVAGALGQGSLDAFFGIIGIMLGAGLFALIYPKIKENLLIYKKMSYTTVPEMLGIKPAYLIPVILILGAGFIYVLENLGL
ncbi:YeeE/YedE family protein [Methanoplanus endosymbiosus]|uniref:YeeE/YedE family protein n=1 Tax=Methanoplanus endosymbiosus TaxID=33865 RepID=A0A9E7PP00_9EURY|nr:YeeE/YedE family protein [Methanoplanus endosymbiosus]UUX92396.1 YeeE/YedE family protein [Methanoplanus endosymbiosus]